MNSTIKELLKKFLIENKSSKITILIILFLINIIYFESDNDVAWLFSSIILIIYALFLLIQFIVKKVKSKKDLHNEQKTIVEIDNDNTNEIKIDNKQQNVNNANQSSQNSSNTYINVNIINDEPKNKTAKPNVKKVTVKAKNNEK